jgi:hypothetical protein
VRRLKPGRRGIGDEPRPKKVDDASRRLCFFFTLLIEMAGHCFHLQHDLLSSVMFLLHCSACATIRSIFDASQFPQINDILLCP